MEESATRLLIRKDLSKGSTPTLEILVKSSIVLVPLAVFILAVTCSVVGLVCYALFLMTTLLLYFHGRDRVEEWELDQGKDLITYRQVGPTSRVRRAIALSKVIAVVKSVPYEPNFGTRRISLIYAGNKKFDLYRGPDRTAWRRFGEAVSKFLQKPLLNKTDFRYLLITGSVAVIVFLLATILSLVFTFYLAGAIFLLLSGISGLFFLYFLSTEYKWRHRRLHEIYLADLSHVRLR